MNYISKANIPSFFFLPYLFLLTSFFSNKDFNIIRITEPKLEKIRKMAISSLLGNKSPESHKLFMRREERHLSTLYSCPPQATPVTRTRPGSDHSKAIGPFPLAKTK